MKTAVYFGGTFDPIHQEHIRVCDLAYNAVRPDKLMLAPAPDGLCKRAAASAEQRLQMCRIAARDRPWLEVSDIEIKQNVRYSADALFHLLEQGEYSKIWFLLGEDQFSTLPQWRGWERIVKIADILAVHRNGELLFPENTARAEQLLQQASARVRWLDETPAAVSSSKLRKDLLEGKRPQGLSDTVFAYILESGLYTGSLLDRSAAPAKLRKAR